MRSVSVASTDWHAEDAFLCADAGRDAARRVDLLVGGFPCQGASVAGKRLGLADDRTALFWEICRIQDTIHAPWALLENVPGLRSVTLGRDFQTVLAALKERWPVVGWRTLDSRYFGVPQRRNRVFFVCGPDEAGVAQILFEREGGGGDLAARGEAGARVAGTLAAGAHPSGFNGRDAEQDKLIVSHPLLAKGNSSFDDSLETYIVAAQCHGTNVGPMGLLRAGDGGLTSGVPFVMNLRGREEGARPELDDKASLRAASGGSSRSYVVADTLNSGGNTGGFRTEPGAHLVTHTLKAEGHDASEDGTGRVVPIVTLRIAGAGNANNLGIYQHGDAPTIDSTGDVAVAWTERTRGDGRNVETQEEIAYSLNNPGAGGRTQENRVAQGMSVRRLTPVECERLQAFPDGWTCLCQPLDAYAADPEFAAERCTCPDGPRYRMMGNAVTVSTAHWLARRLFDVLRSDQTMTVIRAAHGPTHPPPPVKY